LGIKLTSEYIKVVWHHDSMSEPVLMYSELDSDRYESRKVEIYRDGRHHWAGGGDSIGSTLLGEVPVPSLEEIAAQQEFSPELTDREEFEEVWSRARRTIVEDK
jgi:hypothetical protein